MGGWAYGTGRAYGKGKKSVKNRQDQHKAVFTRDFLLIFLAGGLIRICYQIQGTVMPLYGNELGFTAVMVGTTTTVCTAASLILRPVLGIWLDRYGRRIIVLCGTGLFVLATWLCGLTGSFAVLLLRALQGFGFAAHTTAVNTMATDVLPEERMAEGIGYMGLTGSVSLALAPALALTLVEGGRYRQGFHFAFIVGALAVFCLLAVRSVVGREQAAPSASGTYQGWERFWEKEALKPAFIMLILGACYAGVSTFLAIYALGKGFSSSQVSVYFTVNAVATAVARLVGSSAMRRIGMRKGMFAASGLCVSAFLLIPVSSSAVGLWAAAALHGLGYGTIYPQLNALAVTRAAPERRGTAMATFLTGMDIGVGFGAGFWGFIIDRIGMDKMFHICAAVTVLVYVAYRLLLPAGDGKGANKGRLR